MIEEAIDDKLEARVRIAFDEMIPKLLGWSNASSELARAFDDGAFDDGAFEVGELEDAPNEVAVRRATIERRSPRSLVAAGLLVAAGVAGLVVVAQRDDDGAASTNTGVDANTDTNTSLPDGTTAAEPPWYQLMRPLVPERFEYLALVVRDPLEIHVVAVDADDGKALEIGLIQDVQPVAQPVVATAVDELGSWTETAQGLVLQAATGLNISVSCDIGTRGRDFPGPPNYCDMTSTGAFTKAEIRSVVEAFANRFDASFFETDIGVPTDHNVNPAAASAMIADALPAQTLISDTEWGHGDRVFDFGAGADRPDTSVRVLQNLYPRPPITTRAAYALYDDAAAFWMFGADGVAVRISSTDTFPETLARLEQLGAALLATDQLVTRSNDPAPSTTIELIPPTQAPTLQPTTTVVNPTTTLLRTPTGSYLLPTVMPPGFDDVADGYTTETEGAQPYPNQVRAFVGPGDRPAVVVVFSTPVSEVGDQVDLGLRDMTTSSAWPSFGFGVVRPSGEYLWLRSGGLTAADMQFVADHLPADDTSPLQVGTAAADFTEVTWKHDPRNAHGITWNGPEGRTIMMYAESGFGIEALNAGMSWSIQVFDTPIGRVFASVDATDASFVQVGLVIDGQVINIGAHNAAVDDVVAMAASIELADDGEWSRRIVG